MLRRWTLIGLFPAVALIWATGTVATAQSADDEPVGWPVTKVELKKRPRAAVQQNLPANTEITEYAINSWESPPQRIGAQAFEVAPLDRFTPDIKPIRITYSPKEFGLRVEIAEELSKLAMRLRGTSDEITIIAHSGDAQLSTHDAVRLSFQRAILIRTLLLEEGVTADQIHLRALPQAEDDGPQDRVDINPFEEN